MGRTQYSALTIRKLAWLCGGFAAGTTAFLAMPELRFVPALAAAALAILPGRRLRFVLLAVGALLGGVYATAYEALVAEPAFALDGETVCVSAVASDRFRDYYVDVRISVPDGADFDARLYDYDGLLADVSAGDRISGELSLRRSDSRYGESYMGYRGEGLLMLAYPAGELSVERGGGLRYLPRRLCAAIEDTVDIIFPPDTAPFEKALLTGEKGDYYENEALSDAVAKAGLAHVIAVSGMHVSFVVGLVMARPGRKSALLLGVPVVLLFMMMTGLPHSVVRAGIMYFALISAPVLRRESDPPTALLASLALILLLNPAAIFSVGLQLSYAAMAGILIMSRSIENAIVAAIPRPKHRALRRALQSAAGVAAMSIGATVCTTPLVAWHFGYFSTYSVLTNLLTYFVISSVFCLGYPACAVGALSPALGELMAAIISVGVRYVLLVATFVAGLPGSVIYTSSPVMKGWMLLAALLFAAAWLGRGKRRMRLAVPLGLSVVTLCASCMLLEYSSRRLAPQMTVLDVGQGQCIVMLAGGHSVMVDCGCRGELTGAGERAGAYLHSLGVDSLDALILTHLHDDHANGVSELLRLVDVAAIYLAPGLDDSDGLLDEVSSAAAECGTEMVYITQDSLLTAGEIELAIFAPLSAGDANESGLIIHGGVAGLSVLITGDVGASTERELLETKIIGETDVLIVGHHGSSGSTCLELMEELRPEHSVVSVGYNSYGHPTQEALERASSFGAQLWRTDMSGDISFYPAA